MAAELGADAVGFIFAPSMRRVTAAEVARITPHLPDGVERVGVFPAWSVEEIATAATEAGLTAVQLHGELSLDEMERLRHRFAGEVIPVISWQVGDEASAGRVAARLGELQSLPAIERVLIDSKVNGASGGTGVSFDWSAARGVFYASSQALILAGGLKPENVRAAVFDLDPWGVDVSSGVEVSPGRKDRAKVEQFLREAKQKS